MRLSISSDYRFVQTMDGAIWTEGPCHYRHWTRYLSVFDEINVIACVRQVDRPSESSLRSDGANVQFTAAPHYQGALGYARQVLAVRKRVREAIRGDDAVMINAPGQIGSCLMQVLSPRYSHPYGIQVLGDPYEVLAPGVVKHPLRPFLRWWLTRRLCYQAKHASAALYVTRAALQKRYPCPAAEFGVSDVDLESSAFRAPLRRAPESSNCQLISVGTMSQMYKGFDVLIEAISLLAKDIPQIHLTLVGDGKFRPQLETLAKRLGVSNRVKFRGQLSAGEEVRRALDAASLFVLPSRTEGLPRALIEAMARGLPCIATNVGGIPELLANNDLVQPGCVEGLAATLRRVIQSPARRREMARRNYSTALKYHAGRLTEKRQAFYRYLWEATFTARPRDSWSKPQTCLEHSPT